MINFCIFVCLSEIIVYDDIDGRDDKRGIMFN